MATTNSGQTHSATAGDLPALPQQPRDGDNAISAQELRRYIAARSWEWSWITKEYGKGTLTPALSHRIEAVLPAFESAQAHLDVANIPALHAKLKKLEHELQEHWKKVLGSPNSFCRLKAYIGNILLSTYAGWAVDYMETNTKNEGLRSRARIAMGLEKPQGKVGTDGLMITGEKDGKLAMRYATTPQARDFALDEMELFGESRERILEWIGLVAASKYPNSVDGAEFPSTLQSFLDAGDADGLKQRVESDCALIVRVLEVAISLGIQPETWKRAQTVPPVMRDYFVAKYSQDKSSLKGKKFEKVCSTKRKKQKAHERKKSSASSSSSKPTVSFRSLLRKVKGKLEQTTAGSSAEKSTKDDSALSREEEKSAGHSKSESDDEEEDFLPPYSEY